MTLHKLEFIDFKVDSILLTMCTSSVLSFWIHNHIMCPTFSYRVFDAVSGIVLAISLEANKVSMAYNLNSMSGYGINVRLISFPNESSGRLRRLYSSTSWNYVTNLTVFPTLQLDSSGLFTSKMQCNFTW